MNWDDVALQNVFRLSLKRSGLIPSLDSLVNGNKPGDFEVDSSGKIKFRSYPNTDLMLFNGICLPNSKIRLDIDLGHILKIKEDNDGLVKLIDSNDREFPWPKSPILSKVAITRDYGDNSIGMFEYLIGLNQELVEVAKISRDSPYYMMYQFYLRNVLELHKG